jgi:hypothetical protein
MYTANISKELNLQIEDKVDTIIKNVRDKSRKLLTSCNDYGEVSKQLDDYIISCCNAEVRGISASLFSDLHEQASHTKLFNNSELVDEYYSIDMRTYLTSHCYFKMQDNFAIAPKDCKKLAILVGGGIAVVGSAISLLLMLPVGIIPSVLVGAVAYPITNKLTERANLENYLVSVELYLKELKSAFVTWVRKFEALYSETLSDIMCKVNY